MSFTAEILGVGTELLLGNIANTDAQEVSQALSELGINVYFHTVVGDNPARLSSAVETAKSRADILITTGGLGPTLDDLTKETVAACFGKKLVLHEPTLERIKAYFARIGKQPTPNNERQAWLPEDCYIFENDWGTAPGCAFQAQGKHVLMLPGPPRECVSMLRACAVPYLKSLSDSAIVSSQIRIFGMGESAVEDRLHDMMERMQNPTVAPYAKEGEVMLRVTAKADTAEDAQALLEPVVAQIRRVLGNVVYGVDVDSLEQVVVTLLNDKKLTLGLAESCTGGLVSKRITDIPGASGMYKGGVCAYSNELKENILSVSGQLLAQEGAVSEAVAVSMAQGVRTLMNADVGVGITGIAGPTGGFDNKPVGLVYVAIDYRGDVECAALQLGTDRGRIRVQAASHALDMVRRHVLGLKD